MPSNIMPSNQEKQVLIDDKPMNGIKIERYFSSDDQSPFDSVEWDFRDAHISNEKKEVIFEQRDVEMPSNWSQLATNVVVSKYFKGEMGTDERETSLKQVINRVVNTISEWGLKDGYFNSIEDSDRFRDELAMLILHQHMSFNSPVWFNVGIEERPQCSACFINSVEDTMESILELAKTEGMLFKHGSGAGSNLSTLRSSREGMSGGGKASGPVSFMKGYDAFAGVIKSGGKTRRAAKMVILNVDHPDILDFINCKVTEERKAKALIKAGYDPSFDGEAYSSIYFQNANHSVRVTDEFMRAVQSKSEFSTKAVKTGDVVQNLRADNLLRQISAAAWETGDPGLQFDTTINHWHTCANSARINASNPCSEFMFLDDSACNLASLNLMSFQNEDDSFNHERFRAAVRLTILAQEIIVDNASYPTKRIEKNSQEFRPLGLGYANLGALLMSHGLAYDSAEGRAYAAALTALMHGEAYRTSAEISASKGPFKHFEQNRDVFLRVIQQHKDAIDSIDENLVPDGLVEVTRSLYENMYELGKRYGFRNSQVTLLAPTGTIAFMMDCDTTGIEPDIALVKYKNLVGGGMLKIVNQTIPKALQKLGYTEEQIESIIAYIDKNDTIEGAPGLSEEHLPVFDCAFKPKNGKRSIHHMGHIRMMAAVQPFLSGAISKTVNMDFESTVDDIYETYVNAWEMGLKAIAIYRDGCKAFQPLNTSKNGSRKEETNEEELAHRPYREKLPDERNSYTHKFSVGGHEGYITVGMYTDGRPGEIFIVMSKEGSAVSGLMDSFATATSIALQYGVPLPTLVHKFTHTRFEPAGYTNNPKIPVAHSLMDYIFRWLALKFLSEEEMGFNYEQSLEETSSPQIKSANQRHDNGDNGKKNTTQGIAGEMNQDEILEEAIKIAMQDNEQKALVAQNQLDAPPCPECGAILVRNGSCYKCLNCGTTSGCS